MRPGGWIAIAVLLASALVLFIHLGTNVEEFSRYNIGWNGTSVFTASLDRHTTRDVTGPGDLGDSTNATLLVIAPDRAFTADDGTMYRNFISKGNTLFLADDYGTGPALLQAMGSGIMIRQENLSSLDRAYNDPYMVVAYSVNDSRYLPEGSPLLLDHAAVLDGGDPLVATTVFSWEDTVPDRQLSANETLGRFEVMAQETIGNGTLIVLSDPSVFINAMEDPGYTNRQFRAAFANSGPVLIDGYGSRVTRQDTTGEVIQAVRSNTAYMFAAAALLMAGVLFAWHRHIL